MTISPPFDLNQKADLLSLKKNWIGKGHLHYTSAVARVTLLLLVRDVPGMPTDPGVPLIAITHNCFATADTAPSCLFPGMSAIKSLGHC
jgi:hypothetical protein